jgi:hypothetical protein
LTPHTAVAGGSGIASEYLKHLDGIASEYLEYLEESCCFTFNADGKDIIAFALSTEHLSEICDVVVRLLAVSAVQSVRLMDWNHGAVINAPTLAYLMEQCQSLKVLTLATL